MFFLNYKKRLIVLSQLVVLSTFTPYDFFVTTNRDRSGRDYENFKKALFRLSGTRIQTNIIFSEKDKKQLILV